jgi:hypothetical protein
MPREERDKNHCRQTSNFFFFQLQQWIWIERAKHRRINEALMDKHAKMLLNHMKNLLLILALEAFYVFVFEASIFFGVNMGEGRDGLSVAEE